MRVANLQLQNWRNFSSVDVPLQERSFLVGPNAAGKSNFLDALRFLRDLADIGGGFERAVLDRGGVPRLRWLSARRNSEIILDAVVVNEEARWRYRLVFTQDSQHRPRIKEESVWHDDQILLRRPDSEDNLDPERLRQTHLEQVSANSRFRAVADFFASIQYYHIVPQLVREPERWQGRGADAFGADLVERILSLQKSTRDSRLRRFEQALSVAVPQLAGLRVARDERGVGHLHARYQHWRPQGAWQTEQDLSDGTLRLIGLLWALTDSTGPILLEEPELSLHPDVVRRIPQLMGRVTSRESRQILVSTHSADLLSDEGIGPGEVLLFIPGKEGTSIQIGATLEDVNQLIESGFTIGEAIQPLTRPADVERLSTALG
jgi:predicted ATPase